MVYALTTHLKHNHKNETAKEMIRGKCDSNLFNWNQMLFLLAREVSLEKKKLELSKGSNNNISNQITKDNFRKTKKKPTCNSALLKLEKTLSRIMSRYTAGSAYF